MSRTGGYGEFAEYYDILTENVGYARRAEYIAGLLTENGARDCTLLDLACGTGSMSVELARRGYDVIAVDGSCQMLSVAQSKSFEANCNILFLCQQMQKLDLYGTVKAAVCTLDSLNHLTDSHDIEQTFGRVSLFLEPDGVFVFDMNTLYKHREILSDNTFVYDTDEVYCVWQNNLDRATDTVSITLDFFGEEDGVYYRSGESFSERAYDLRKVEQWLSAAGLTVIGEYEELTREKPSAETQRVVVVCKKIC